MLSIVDLSWSAGFIDGEGCIGIYEAKNCFQFRLSVAQNNLKPLQKLVHLFGGGLYFQTDKATQWCVTNLVAAGTLEQVQPYLVCKDEQAELFIEACRMWFGRSKRFATPIERQVLREAVVAIKSMKRA